MRSADSVTAYREKIGDAWSPWIAELYQQAKQHWAYLVPADPSERRVLRDICARTLAFENQYLLACRDYLEAERRQPDPERRRLAADGLSKVDFRGISARAP